MKYGKKLPWLFLLPTLVGLILFRLGPMVAALFISFTRWNVITPPEFIGLSNYKEMFASNEFWML